MAKEGQVKWEMKLLVSRPSAVSRLSPSWSLPTVTTDKTCTYHACLILIALKIAEWNVRCKT